MELTSCRPEVSLLIRQFSTRLPVDYSATVHQITREPEETISLLIQRKFLRELTRKPTTRLTSFISPNIRKAFSIRQRAEINQFSSFYRKASKYKNQRRSEMRRWKRIKLPAELEAKIYRRTNDKPRGNIYPTKIHNREGKG